MTRHDVEKLLPGTKILIADDMSDDYVSTLEPFLGKVVTVRKVNTKHDKGLVYFEENIGPDAYFYSDEIVEVVCVPDLDDKSFEPEDINLLLNVGDPYA